MPVPLPSRSRLTGSRLTAERIFASCAASVPERILGPSSYALTKARSARTAKNAEYGIRPVKGRAACAETLFRERGKVRPRIVLFR